MEDSYERLRRALDDGHHLALATLAVSLLAGHRHTHGVSVKSTTGLGCLHEHIILVALHNNEGIALTGHLNPSLNQWEHLLFLLSTSLSAGIILSCHSLLFLSLQN